MNGIVEVAVETARPLIEQRRHELTVSLPPEPIWLHADAARLAQVVVNLLTNAAKYTEEGGHVWLTVQQEGDECVLRMQDTGVGITPELLPRIFDLFTQADRSLDRSQGGLGIGLALVHRLTDLHGGEVKAFSTLGQGSEFVVRLPVVPTDTPQPPSPVTETGQPTTRPLRVLVVDDNEDTVLSFSMLLKASGHDVRTAHDGPTAVQAALDYRPERFRIRLHTHSRAAACTIASCCFSDAHQLVHPRGVAENPKRGIIRPDGGDPRSADYHSDAVAGKREYGRAARLERRWRRCPCRLVVAAAAPVHGGRDARADRRRDHPGTHLHPLVLRPAAEHPESCVRTVKVQVRGIDHGRSSRAACGRRADAA